MPQVQHSESGDGMFRFLFNRRGGNQPVAESQRQSFDRLVSELNSLIDDLPDKPRVTVDPATGHILPEPPEQFPDEALALPAPSQDTPAPKPGTEDRSEAVAA